MTTDPIQLRAYTREHIANFLDQINEEIDRHPERWQLAPEERAEWAGFPAQARAHRYHDVLLDPNHPIGDYLRSRRIGPDYTPTKSTTQK